MFEILEHFLVSWVNCMYVAMLQRVYDLLFFSTCTSLDLAYYKILLAIASNGSI